MNFTKPTITVYLIPAIVHQKFYYYHINQTLSFDKPLVAI
uniref:Uncharacterized protein n=1 Tax=Ciona intestinalis TaxID=7719 RepID=H2XXL4_CIOIN